MFSESQGNISYLTDARIAVGATKQNPDSVDIFKRY